MRKIILLSLIWLGTIGNTQQNGIPDLNKSEDLQKLGIGKIIEKDRSILKQVTLKEINGEYVVYVKNESLHDMHLGYIDHLEFPLSKWGNLTIEFANNKPVVTILP